jgi:hypothetical protein
MGNKSNKTEIGGYITATDRNNRYTGGIILNGYLPRLYYENHNDVVLSSDPFRCFFEILGDRAYISHSFPEINWVIIREETPQSVLFTLIRNIRKAPSISINIQFLFSFQSTIR